MRRLVILGAGGHGQTVSDIAAQTGKYTDIIFLDDNAENVSGKCKDFLLYKNEDTEMYPAFGNNDARLEWENVFIKNEIRLAKIIHPSAYISPTAVIDDGSVVFPYAILNTNSIVKKACIINCGAIVDHGCIIEEGVHVSPGAIVKAENCIPSKMKIESGEVIPIRHYPVQG